MEDNETLDEHESYGQISLGRTNGGSRFLYGSSIKHEHTIRIEVHTSERVRKLNNDWYHKNERIVELEISPTQFSELIMSRDNYGGVPCTLLYTKEKGRIHPPIIKGKVEEFEDEFENRMNEISKGVADYEKRCTEILERKGTVKVAEKREILNMFHKLRQELRSNIPFVYQCFNEQMDKTVLEAKGEVEAFVDTKLRSLGIDHAGGDMIVDKRDPDKQIKIDYESGDE